MKARGFNVIRFSPNPEEIEHVNVALLLWGSPWPLRYKEDFPKLRCVAGDTFPLPLLKEYLAHVQRQSAKLSPANSHDVLNRFSAQLRVLPFREAPRVSNLDFVEALEERYLSAAEHEHRERRRRRPSIESQLDVYLTKVLRSDDFLRKPTAEDILGAHAAALFGGEKLSVTRAFRGTSGLVLIEALDLCASKSQIEGRAGRMGYRFHRFGEAQGVLKAQNQQLRRVAMFLGELEPGSPKQPVRDWARGLVRHDSERIIERDAQKALQSEAQQVGALLAAN